MQEDEEPEPSTRGKNTTDGEIDSSKDEPMVQADDAAGEKAAKSVSSRQNEKLYAAEGVLNTKLKRAVKKKRKVSKKTDSMEDDYNFKVDYIKDGSAMDDDELVDDIDKNKSQLPVPEVDLDK